MFSRQSTDSISWLRTLPDILSRQPCLFPEKRSYQNRVRLNPNRAAQIGIDAEDSGYCKNNYQSVKSDHIIATGAARKKNNHHVENGAKNPRSEIKDMWPNMPLSRGFSIRRPLYEKNQQKSNNERNKHHHSWLPLQVVPSLLISCRRYSSEDSCPRANSQKQKNNPN